MVKYHFRVYDHDDNLVISSIVPANAVFDWIERYRDYGVVKAYVLSESEEKNI